MPTISVIVPVYKVEPYLRRCVDSILGQTYTDFELILVDDGSPDSCGAICDEYAEKDARVRVIHQENGGLSAARNAGIDWVFANSDSEWLTFVDSDDVLSDCFLQRLYEVAKSEKSEIVVGDYAHFTDDKELQELYEESEPATQCSGIQACEKLYDTEFVKFVTAWGKLYCSSLFDNIRFPKGKIHEDEATTYKLYLAVDRVAIVKDKLYYYRFNPNGIMQTRTFAKFGDYYEALQEREKIFRSQGLDDLANRTANLLSWRITLDSILAKAAGQHRMLPKAYRISTPIALRRMYHNCEHRHFVQYLRMVYPTLAKIYEFLYNLR